MKKFNEWYSIREQMVPPPEPMGQPEAPGAMEDLAGWTLPSGARMAVAKFKEFLPEGALSTHKQRLAVLAAVMFQMGIDIQTFQLAIPKIKEAMAIDAKRAQAPGQSPAYGDAGDALSAQRAKKYGVEESTIPKITV